MAEVAIVGASGYTGGELLRFLIKHPNIEIVAATSRKHDGVPIHKIHPHLQNTGLKFKNIDPEDIDADLVFTATPHGASMKIVPKILERGIRVIDLSGDYRFDNVEVYEKWYGIKHEHPLDAVYGLPELYRDEIKKADLVANPGCFPTGAILACLPLVHKNLTKMIVIDSKTGVSGAGINPSHMTHFPECSDNIIPYQITTHRHTPEIEQELKKISDVQVSFTPHLIPIIRGILTTVHAFLEENIDVEKIEKIYKKYYSNEPFVIVIDETPEPSAVRGSNYCHIGGFGIDKNNRLVVISVIDNLVKGASGQAIQNMNLMLGFDETEGLDNLGLHP